MMLFDIRATSFLNQTRNVKAVTVKYSPKIAILVVCFLLLANSKLVESSTGDDDSDKVSQVESTEFD